MTEEALTAIQEDELRLTGELRQVAQARAGLEAARKRLADAKAIYGIDAMEDSLVIQGRMVKECEDMARTIGLTLYSETHQKNLLGGMKIREISRVIYQDAKALAYCMVHAPALLRFDTKAFEKLAKAVIEAGQGLDFVEIEQTFEATIPQDLSALIARPAMVPYTIQVHDPKEGGNAPTGA